MADKVIWKTGDTITADKLNGSGIYSIPTGGTFEEQTTPETTAKDVLNAAKAGKLICILDYNEWEEEGEEYVGYSCNVVEFVDKIGTAVSMGYGEKEFTATYPDGIFTSSGGK